MSQNKMCDCNRGRSPCTCKGGVFVQQQSLEIERLQLTCNDLDDQNDRIYAELAALKAQHEQDAQTIKVLQAMVRQLKAQPSGVVLPEPEIASEINRLIGLWDAKVAWSGQCMEELLDHAARAATLIARLNSSPVSAGEPVYQFQCREIGEGDWEPCDHSRYMYCQKSPEMDTRVVQVLALSAPSHGEQVREGWKLVPVKPSIDMVEAGYEASLGCPDRGSYARVIEQYDAMLSAAPSAGSQKEQGE